MAHQQDAGAVDVPVTHTVDSAAAALSSVFQSEAPEEEEREEQTDNGEQDPGVNDEFAEDDFTEESGADEGEEGEQEDEPEEPAIEAPVSLTADEKAAFSQLPKEAQDFVSSLEQRRNQDVQKVTTKAAEAQREAEHAKAAAATEAKQLYASQLQEFTAAFAPQEPQPGWYQSQQEFDAAYGKYAAQKAQHDELVQQIKAVGTEATEEATRAFVEQRDRELMAIPEIANEETREAYLSKAMGAASRLGYDVADLAQTMDAEDVKRLYSVADAFEKASKYDAAMSRRMQRVRAGKARTLKPGTAQPSGSGNRAFDAAKQRLQKTGSVDDAAAAFKAIL